MVTSNHVHLLVIDDGHRDTIPKSIQLIAGRTAQEYNQRRDRKGAYWEDRYHATGIEDDDHLAKCMLYIDMNMVRAGVVAHPKEWVFSGYQEIQNPKQRYSLIDYSFYESFIGIHMSNNRIIIAQKSITAGMIEMVMAVNDILYVFVE